MNLSESKSIQNQNGEIVFTGTDIAVPILFNYLKAGRRTEDFLDDYAQVNLEQVLDVLELAEEQLIKVF
jgi:uncharacterized protein (DUF433 family)